MQKMYLFILNIFILVIVFHNIENGYCRRRTTMEEDINNPDKEKIHAYNPLKRNKARQNMHFHKDFPISVLIITPLRRILDAFEAEVLQNLHHKVEHHLLDQKINGSQELKNKFEKAKLSEFVEQSLIDKPAAPHETTVANRLLSADVDKPSSELRIIKEIFGRLDREFNGSNEEITNRLQGGRSRRLRIKPGYCLIFGICTGFLCNCF